MSTSVYLCLLVCTSVYLCLLVSTSVLGSLFDAPSALIVSWLQGIKGPTDNVSYCPGQLNMSTLHIFEIFCFVSFVFKKVFILL